MSALIGANVYFWDKIKANGYYEIPSQIIWNYKSNDESWKCSETAWYLKHEYAINFDAIVIGVRIKFIVEILQTSNKPNWKESWEIRKTQPKNWSFGKTIVTNKIKIENKEKH